VNQRQMLRRNTFIIAMKDMPYFEQWTDDDGRPHVKAIPRRVRRSMARAKAGRIWRESSELMKEPKK
jgi:hypothetical protein